MKMRKATDYFSKKFRKLYVKFYEKSIDFVYGISHINDCLEIKQKFRTFDLDSNWLLIASFYFLIWSKHLCIYALNSAPVHDIRTIRRIILKYFIESTTFKNLVFSDSFSS